jgi:hypothetical protein
MLQEATAREHASSSRRRLVGTRRRALAYSFTSDRNDACPPARPMLIPTPPPNTSARAIKAGEVAEWLNAPHSKCGMGASSSGVRIPPSPPAQLCKSFCSNDFCPATINASGRYQLWSRSSLSRRGIPLFRILAELWRREPQALPQLAILAVRTRDPLLRFASRRGADRRADGDAGAGHAAHGRRRSRMVEASGRVAPRGHRAPAPLPTARWIAGNWRCLSRSGASIEVSSSCRAICVLSAPHSQLSLKSTSPELLERADRLHGLRLCWQLVRNLRESWKLCDLQITTSITGD